MKTFCRFFSFVLFLLIVVIVLLNSSNTITLETSFLSLRANVGFLILFCATISSLATILLGMSLGWFFLSDRKTLKNQLEKTKLGFELESDKSRQLEAKIKTLEEALKMATKKQS